MPSSPSQHSFAYGNHVSMYIWKGNALPDRRITSILTCLLVSLPIVYFNSSTKKPGADQSENQKHLPKKNPHTKSQWHAASRFDKSDGQWSYRLCHLMKIKWNRMKPGWHSAAFWINDIKSKQECLHATNLEEKNLWTKSTHLNDKGKASKILQLWVQ